MSSWFGIISRRFQSSAPPNGIDALEEEPASTERSDRKRERDDAPVANHDVDDNETDNSDDSDDEADAKPDLDIPSAISELGDLYHKVLQISMRDLAPEISNCNNDSTIAQIAFITSKAGISFSQEFTEKDIRLKSVADFATAIDESIVAASKLNAILKIKASRKKTLYQEFFKRYSFELFNLGLKSKAFRGQNLLRLVDQAVPEETNKKQPLE
jgi:hypothetical protein